MNPNASKFALIRKSCRPRSTGIDLALKLSAICYLVAVGAAGAVAAATAAIFHFVVGVVCVALGPLELRAPI